MFVEIVLVDDIMVTDDYTDIPEWVGEFMCWCNTNLRTEKFRLLGFFSTGDECFNIIEPCYFSVVDLEGVLKDIYWDHSSAFGKNMLYVESFGLDIDENELILFKLMWGTEFNLIYK